MASGTGFPIMVVDDYVAMSRLLRKILQGLGFTEIDQAKDGSSALAKLREKPYGLVVSDLRMEPMSGLALLREIRGDAALKRIPFIMVTASGESDQVIAAKKAGVSDYIVKPFTAQTVQRKLEAVFGETFGPSWCRVT